MTLPPPPQYSTGNADGGSSQPATSRRGYFGGQKLASWPKRTISTLIDFGVTVFLPSLLPGAAFEAIVMLILVGANSVVMQNRTYQSLGKALLGLSLVRPQARPEGTFMVAPGFIRCALRIVAHLADTIFFIGFLRPIWEENRQTFADTWAFTLVIDGKPGYRVT